MTSQNGPAPRGRATLGVHAGGPDPAPGGPVVAPVVQSATFFAGGAPDAGELRYTRYGNNPNQVSVGQKIAATLASTGTRSHFLHPGEAIHGDLGRVHRDDVVLMLSFSGETEEITRLLPSLAERGHDHSRYYGQDVAKVLLDTLRLVAAVREHVNLIGVLADG